MSNFLAALFIPLIFLILNGCSDNSPQPPTHVDIEFLKASGLSLPSKYKVLFFENNKANGIEFNITWLLYSKNTFIYPTDASVSQGPSLEKLISTKETVDFIKKFMTYSQRKEYKCIEKNVNIYKTYRWTRKGFNFLSTFLEMNDGSAFVFISIQNEPRQGTDKNFITIDADGNVSYH